MQRKINDTWFVYEWGKFDGKNPIGWFSGHYSRNSTIITTSDYKQRNLKYLTNLQLNPYPNTQLDLFCNDSFPFNARLPSTWLTNCADPNTRLQSPTKKVVGCKFLQFILTMKIKKILGHKTLRCTYTATSSQEWWTRARTSSPVTICLNRVFSMLVQLTNLLTALKIIILYV